MTDITQVEISRRNFIKGMLGLAMALRIPDLPGIDGWPPVAGEDGQLPLDDFASSLIGTATEERITIKQSDKYIGTIKINDDIYPLLSVDIAYQREYMPYAWGIANSISGVSIDFSTDAPTPWPSPEIKDIELLVKGTQLAIKSEGYFTGKIQLQNFNDEFYLWNCEVQLIGKPEFIT